jgi:hypothetical protein
MALPKAVQDQLDQVAAIEQELSGAENQQTEQNVDQAVGQTPATEVPPQIPVPDPAAPDWERRYQVLQGKYDAEVPRLHAEVREITQRMQAMSQQLEAAKQAKVETKPVENVSLVSEQDKEVFGEDLVNLQERIARAATKPLENVIHELTKRLEKYESVADVAASNLARTTEERYFDKLAQSIPNWQEVNTNQQWIDWLNGRYPGMTMTRQEQLNAARASLDINTTVEMFKAFLDMTAPPAKPTTPNQNLQSQVAPPKTRSSSSAPTPDSSKRIWTSAEVVAALDYRRMKDMTPEEVVRVMSEIDAAQAEGRVKP